MRFQGQSGRWTLPMKRNGCDSATYVLLRLEVKVYDGGEGCGSTAHDVRIPLLFSEDLNSAMRPLYLAAASFAVASSSRLRPTAGVAISNPEEYMDILGEFAPQYEAGPGVG